MSSYSTATVNGPSPTDEPDGSTSQQAKDKAQETAQRATGDAKRRVRDQVDQRSTEAGHRVGSAAHDVRSLGDELRKQGKDQPAKLADQVADRAESLGDYLERSDGDTILRDVEDFGRQQPWAVITGGIVLGFAASRFLKASSSRRSTPETSGTASLAVTPTPVASMEFDPVGTGSPSGPEIGGVSPVDAPTTGPGYVPPGPGL